MMQLSPGLIFQIAADAEIEMKGKGAKRAIHCPFHDDRNASAFVSERNVFYCSVCTPGAGWSAKRFAIELGLQWPLGNGLQIRTPRPAPTATAKPVFSAAAAQGVWRLARARALDGRFIDADREVYEFLDKRGLQEASKSSSFGIVSKEMRLPPEVASWRYTGHRLVAPLYDLTGTLVSLQSRSVRGTEPRTLAPKDGRTSGTVFTHERGLALLRGEAIDEQCVLFGEGLTDSLALAIASPVAFLSVPGASMAVAGVGSWARRRRVIVALDSDPAGQERVEPVARALDRHEAKAAFAITWPTGCKDACDVVAQRGTTGLRDLLRAKIAQVMS